MQKFLDEDLNYAQQEPSEKAAAKAKKLKLSHVGFGRYEDKKSKQVTHIASGDKLSSYSKAVKTNSYNQTSGDDIGNLIKSLMPQTQKLHDFLTQYYNVDKYDDAELNAVYDFTGTEYTNVNKRLCEVPIGSVPAPKSADDYIPEIIKSLDSAIKKSRAPAEFLVYTKVTADGLDNFKEGKSFKSKGFRSTSISINAVLDSVDESAEQDGQIIILQIKVKKNTKGIYVANFSAMPEESEFILPRGVEINILAGPKRLVGSDATTASNMEIVYFDCVAKG